LLQPTLYLILQNVQKTWPVKQKQHGNSMHRLLKTPFRWQINRVCNKRHKTHTTVYVSIDVQTYKVHGQTHLRLTMPVKILIPIFQYF
jgi:hypothetical protein